MKITLYVAIFFAMTLGAMSQIFYEVSDPAVPNAKVYLLGSIHAADSTFYPLDKQIYDAFNESDALITEINLEEKDLLGASINKVLCYAEGDSVKNHITDSTYAMLCRYFEANNIPEYVFNRFTPALISIVIDQIETEKAGLNCEDGIDMYFTKIAENRDIIGLETAEQQLAIIQMVNYCDDPGNMLCEQIKCIENDISDLREMIAAWKAHDAEKIDYLVKENIKQAPESEQKFNEQIYQTRNTNFVSQIRSFIGSGKTYFAIIGSAHIVGNGGIADLLSKGGFNVGKII
ncbi:MAG: TraB/GumN family protein [Candidatus Kapabacteria bacterium]|nr:TraB/GumN family protein [Candidatus Kapabacteria bacterium]